jgi:hypothetical protein
MQNITDIVDFKKQKETEKCKCCQKERENERYKLAITKIIKILLELPIPHV